ncbi:MAG: glycosyltransferase family 9 protein [Elusimicrobiota bacterium]|jgi:ADP-heptose:LPS heptosyltransferase
MNLDPIQVKAVTAMLTGRLGDLIIATPMLRALRARYPGARLRLMVSAPIRDAARLMPGADEILAVHPYYRPDRNLRCAAALIAQPCDLLVDLNPSFSRTSSALAWLARARVKAAFAKGRLDRLYDHCAAKPAAGEHMLDRYARLAALLGAPYEPRLELRLAPEHLAAAAALLPDRTGIRPAGTGYKLRIGIHAGNFKKFDNRWPEDKFAALTDRLLDEPDLEVFHLAGPGERPRVQAIVSRLKRPVPILGPAPVGVTAALLQRLDLLVCNITGTTHLAAALGVPTFGLYAGYTDAVWRPRGPRHNGAVAADWESCRSITVAAAEAGLLAALAALRK